MMVPTYSPSTQEEEAQESGVQGHPWLHSKSETSLNYLRPYLKKKKETKYNDDDDDDSFTEYLIP